MSILGNYENNFDTETTTANNSMGFDPSAIQTCYPPLSTISMLQYQEKVVKEDVLLVCGGCKKYIGHAH